MSVISIVVTIWVSIRTKSRVSTSANWLQGGFSLSTTSAKVLQGVWGVWICHNFVLMSHLRNNSWRCDPDNRLNFWPLCICIFIVRICDKRRNSYHGNSYIYSRVSFRLTKNHLDVCSLKKQSCRIKKYWTYPPLNTCHSPDGIQEFSGGDDLRVLVCFRGIWWWFSKSSKEDDVWVAIGSEGGLFAGKCNKDLGQGESSDDEDDDDDDTI